MQTPGPSSPLPQARCPDPPEPTGTSCFTITIRNFAFDPPTLRVPTSAHIVFVNADGPAHSIAWADGTPTSPELATGQSTDRSFFGATATTLDYICGIHGSRMKGQIVIDPTMPLP